AIPVTANGKVDRKALPAPDPSLEQAAEYVPARTDVETALARIWADVLGVERVGLHDNFFELGGDSILSLQIIARARAAGLQLSIADVFANQSVGELAPLVRQGPANPLAEQGTVSGPVPLTPIQHWFTRQDIADRDHWNWAGLFEVRAGTDSRVLAQAVGTLVEHHDALRLRLTRDGDLGTWRQHNAPREDGQVFWAVDAAGLEPDRLERLVTEHMTALQTSSGMAGGPLLRVAFFDRGDQPGWLGIIVHHLATDVLSWNVLLEDLDLAYEAIAATGTAEGALTPKTTSFKQWSETLQAFAATEQARAELPYWIDQLEPAFAVPVDMAGANTEATTEVVEARLDADVTAALLTRANRAYGTQAIELMLAALLQALGGWAGTGRVTVDMENHGREALEEEIDLSRTVGWFTSVFPVALSGADLGDPGAVISSVREQLRRTPRRGVGYGALRYLAEGGEEVLRRFRELPMPQVGYNYRSGFDAVADDAVGLLVRELPGDLCGPSTGADQTRSHLLQIEASRTGDGEMLFEWIFSTAVHRTETIERVAARYVAALQDLVEHCLSVRAGD
ncbi:condensation domain-containing protein, partial [Nonomuraea lactucae]|uniref:condensation domain-containing protein n=1 Tax=Nonomuraea lactucae TaxID=2249762 RepID=UPI001F05355E